MGTRYILEVKCPKCGALDDGVYYAPTCGFTTHECTCGNVIDLEEYTGVSYEDASNAAEIEKLLGIHCSHSFPENEPSSRCAYCGLTWEETLCYAGSGIQKQEQEAAGTGA